MRRGAPGSVTKGGAGSPFWAFWLQQCSSEPQSHTADTGSRKGQAKGRLEGLGSGNQSLICGEQVPSRVSGLNSRLAFCSSLRGQGVVVIELWHCPPVGSSAHVRVWKDAGL